MCFLFNYVIKPFILLVTKAFPNILTLNTVFYAFLRPPLLWQTFQPFWTSEGKDAI